MNLQKLPRIIRKKGKAYRLWIYPDGVGYEGWCVEYAVGRLYCDTDNGCASDDFYLLCGVTEKTIEQAIEKILNKIERIIREDD